MSFKKSELILRRWGRRNRPVRNLILWGWDERNNPSFLILFGFHEFENKQVDFTDVDIEKFNEEMILTGISEYEKEISPGTYHVLENNVEYLRYIVFRGNQGHFPNLKNLVLNISSFVYGYEHEGKHEYKRPYRHYSLENCPPIKLPFFKSISYDKLVGLLKDQEFDPKDFRLANTPNELLNLENDSLKYFDLTVNLFSNASIYKREKSLKELINMKPSKDIFKIIFELGSSEVISGLLLDLARERDSFLENEVKTLISEQINWTEDKYGSGLKRCGTLYLNAIDPKSRESRVNEIQEYVKCMDLIPVNAKKPKWIKKKEPGMSYADYLNNWGSSEWQDFGPSLRFESNLFTNGSSLNHIFLKNILQEAYIYDLPDIIGKIAHFIDTPKFHYLMMNSGWYNTSVYFERYIRRILNEYAHSNEKNYIEAIKNFLTSYKMTDIVITYRSNVEFNNLLNSFLEPPRSTLSGRWHNYRDHSLVPRIQSKDFKYERQKYEYNLRNNIWKNHPEEIIDILSFATVDKVLNLFFEIFRESPNIEEIFINLSTRSLVILSTVKYYQISCFFKIKLIERVNQSERFNPELMLSLMESSNAELHSQARDYFNRVKGTFNPEYLVKILWLETIDLWFEFFEENVNKFDGNQYYDFIVSLFIKNRENIRKQVHLQDKIIELLMKSSVKINEISNDKKGEMIEISLNFLLNEPMLHDWLARFIQNLICSIKLEDLTFIIKSLKLDLKKEQRNQYAKDLVSFLVAIMEDNVPNDAELLDIIKFGTSIMLNMLITMIDNKKHSLIDRTTTLMLLFESDIMAFNEISAEVFKIISEKKRVKLLSVLIDSPIKKAYLFALNKLDELFEKKLPKEIIIQMIEHGALEIKAYISNKINYIINELSNGNSELFMYYFKTLVLLPNLYSKSKDRLYEIIPQFALKNKEYIEEIQRILLELGGSNIIKDSERALVAFVKIKQEVERIET